MTEEQQKAACHGKGAACVIAGAGTGKTRTLTDRIVYLIQTRHIEPSRILVTTFTRKATAELYHKVHESLGDVAHRLQISTIDALIWDLTQQAAHKGFMDSARLIGEAHQRVLLLEAAWETFGCENPSFRRRWMDNADRGGVVGLMEGCQRAELAAGREKQTIQQSLRSKLKKLRGRFDLDKDFAIPSEQDLKRAVRKYFEKLSRLGVVDYDLASKKLLRCLKQHQQITREFASQVDEILVDEFQDTSHVQAEVLVLLSGKRRNIWVVGDQCQQIYEWRGAGPENLRWFIKKTRAKKYYLTGNWRSIQPILDSAYHFLSHRIPGLRQAGLLKPLNAMRSNPADESIYTGTLDRALWLVRTYLTSNRTLRPCDIAILSRKLTKNTLREIEERALSNGLRVQFHSSRADRAMEQTIGNPPHWKPGQALEELYKRSAIQSRMARALLENRFSDIRMLRPLATAAEALDSTSQALTFKEAWPALKTTQDRDVSVTPAVASDHKAVQVMTIHAAKGLEFPIVLLMKLGKGGERSFPNPDDREDCRLAYVGVTRARDLLILVHTTGKKPTQTLSAFGEHLVPIRRKRTESASARIQAPAVSGIPPLIAATHLDYYGQCPLQFAAYHEGRFLPKWSLHQSMGSRTHKAIEYWLRAGMPNNPRVIQQCFAKGYQQGDSPLRTLLPKMDKRIETAYRKTVNLISETYTRPIIVEHRYRYVQGSSGQVEGVIDAVLERRDTVPVLKEWKTSAEIKPDRRRYYELQARVGALALVQQNSHPVQVIDIVPILSPQKTVSILIDKAFVDATKERLEDVFKAIKDRSYEPRRGEHCSQCDLKPQCPAWSKP